ncbi:MAG: type II secretion system minor pseudopilin GspI [Moraxellaceae bacterium]|nr:type II secretion system minor pseudopilin GspI [Moraxellaceae bacterium]
MKNNHKGFTLLEVLVALAVFAVAAMALMKVSESQLRLSQTLEEKTFAH